MAHKMKDCPACKGDTKCTICKGTGRVQTGFLGSHNPCKKCGGNGNCTRCNGKGAIPVD
jgi:DnaJ-class molecular chaperone